jgi:outer membrane protein assembly factor BamA
MFDPESTSYTGVGVFANYRYFPSGKGIYAGVGVNYRFLNTDYSEYNEATEKNAKFNTYGFDFTFGYQFRLVEQLFMDLYLGWGFRYSLQDTEEDEEYWSDAFLDLGYSGFLPVAGLRLGFEF